MNKGHNLRIVIAILFISVGCQATLAQRYVSIKREAAKKTERIKPKNTNEYSYRVVVPSRPVKLPTSLRLDLVYKIGHYQWDLVALRFEKKKGDPFVNISQVVFGSAFPFYKESTGIKDSYRVKSGKLQSEDFNKLLSLADTLYRSNIERKYIGSPNSFGSISGSSGDGTILLQLTDAQTNLHPIIRESGTLHVGSLAERVKYNYEYVRVHLFWEVFHDYLQAQHFLKDIAGDEAVELLISRLKEPSMVDSYQDYYRQSLYVQVLGELGSPKAIPTLEYAAHNNVLEGNWSKYLKEDVSEAIEKIRAKSKAKHYEVLPRAPYNKSFNRMLR